jgi:PAS domain S-box-containing protein
VKDRDKTKKQLINELEEMRQRIADLVALESERKRAEERLERVSQQYQLILDSAGEGIYGVDIQGKATFVNPAAARALQYEPDELIGQLMHKVLHHSKPDGRPYPTDECPIYGAFRCGSVNHVTDEVFWKKDGTGFPVEYTSTPIRRRDEIVGAVVVFNDITDRRQVEEEQRILIAIMEAVHESSDLKEAFNVAIEKVMELTDIDIVGIYLVDEATNEAVLEAHSGFSDRYIERAGRIPHPKGVTWKVINSGESYVVRDVSTDPYVGPAGKESGFQSFMSVPIKIGEKTIGTVNFHSNKKHKFGDREIGLFSSIGTQIAIAVSKAKQSMDLQLINRDLSSLNEIATSVHKSLNVKDVYKVALDTVVVITAFDIVMIYLVEEDTNEAVLHAHRGLTEDYIKRAGRIPHPKGVTWKVINSGELHYTDDVQKDPDIGPAGKALGHHTHVAVPIKQGDKTVGVVNFASRKLLGLTSRDINLLNAIGSQIGTAIVQASLYGKSQNQTEELRGLYEDLDSRSRDLEIINKITQTVHQSLDMGKVYNVALDSVMGLENVDMTMIYLVDESTNEAVLEAHRNVPEHYLIRASRIPRPKGITWKVIESGEILNIEDAQSDPNIGAAGKELGHHSILGVPVSVEGKVLGVVWFLSYKEREFNESEVSLLSTLGNQIAIAVAKAKLYKTSNRRREQIESVYELSKTLNMDLSLDVVLNNIVASARELIKAKYGALAVIGENKEVREFITSLTPEEHRLIGELPVGRGILGMVLKEAKSLRLEDITKHPGSCGFPPNHPPMKSFLGVPIILKGKLLGAIYLAEKEGGMMFSSDDQEMLETVASTAGITIENARLFDRITQSERELKEINEKLKELDVMKDDFISMASHELRTPLTAINGFVSMLLEGDYGSLPTEAVEALADVNSATKRLIGLTNYMLDVSRIEEGRLEFKISDFDIGKVCDKVITDLKPIAQEKGLKMEYEKPTVVGTLLVSGDKFRVEQVVINLIGNALKFTERGGVVITHHSNDSYIITDVIDTGIGIPEQDHKLLFQKFRSVQSSLSGDYKGGIGLGLYISKLLLNEMRGDVWLEDSESGQGSTFSFSLPKARAQLDPDREPLQEN